MLTAKEIFDVIDQGRRDCDTDFRIAELILGNGRRDLAHCSRGCRWHLRNEIAGIISDCGAEPTRAIARRIHRLMLDEKNEVS